MNTRKEGAHSEVHAYEETAVARNMSGPMARIEEATFLECMKRHPEVIGAMNLFALNLLESPTPGIPVNAHAVKQLASQRFGTARTLAF